jgi:type IX secretion system PorP/SprF family membrane protein
MNKRILHIAIAALLVSTGAAAQSIHFSQFYNAPMLMNPALTALLPEHDYRLGANYRNQWASVPVPYSTFSAYADMQALKSEEKYNCFGVGFSLFTDRAGDGLLSLTNGNVSLAYHLQMGQSSILSFGATGGYVQRSLNYDKLTYDFQWDGTTFNAGRANGEKTGVVKTNYGTLSAGVNYTYFSDVLFLKIGGGVMNVNQPKETFYSTGTNEIGMRPTGSVDVTAKLSTNMIINPSVYYAQQKDAYELVFGSLFRYNVQPGATAPTQVIFGGYHRLGDAVIGVIGLKWNDLQVMANYDHTISKLGPYNSGKGAMEFSIIYTGLYPSSGGMKTTLGCPRF